MGRPTIFLCVICLFYLVNSSLSRVLDQSEERTKLCEEAGIVNRSCTAEENILIKKTLVALQEAENARVEKVEFKNDAHTAIGNVSRLEEQKAKAEKLARQLACPTRIRYWIEHLDSLYLNDPGWHIRRVQEIESIVQTSFNRTFLNIQNIVKRLNATLQNPTKFEGAWEMLKKNFPKNQEKSRTHELNIGITPSETIESCNNLGSALEELAEAESVDIAQKRWNKQCSSDKKIWNVLPGEFSWIDNVTLKSLAYGKMIFSLPDLSTKENPETQDDRNFARDLILSEKHYDEFAHRNQNKYYRSCRRVLYYSHDEEIKHLRQTLKEAQPDKPFYVRAERHCEIIGRLWHSVSTVSEHTAGVEVIDEKCLPETKDYVLYIKNLRNKGKDDFVFVIESMSTSCNILPQVKEEE